MDTIIQRRDAERRLSEGLSNEVIWFLQWLAKKYSQRHQRGLPVCPGWIIVCIHNGGAVWVYLYCSWLCSLGMLTSSDNWISGWEREQETRLTAPFPPLFAISLDFDADLVPSARKSFLFLPLGVGVGGGGLNKKEIEREKNSGGWQHRDFVVVFLLLSLLFPVLLLFWFWHGGKCGFL